MPALEPDETLLQRSARTYAEHGVAVFPVAPRGKLPAIPKCPVADTEKLVGAALAEHAKTCPNEGHGFHDATADVATVERWWARWPDANIGVALGVNGVFALDVDGPEGRAELDDLERLYADLPDTYRVQTGRAEGFGMHYLWRQPEGGPMVRSCKPFATPKLEVKGDGGYVVAPPSVHASGRAYMAQGAWAQIADPPPWLLALVKRAPVDDEDAPERLTAAPTPAVTSSGLSAAHERAEKRLRGLAGAVAMAQEGNRNDALNHAAYTAGRLVAVGLLDDAEVRAVLTAAAQRAGLEPGETRATIASGLAAGHAAPEHEALDVLPPTPTPTVLAPGTFVVPPPDVPASQDPYVAQALERVRTGAAFILDADHRIEPVWGADADVAWASGEPLILTGPTGVGKTTICHQIVERLTGVVDDPLLGLPVTARAKRVLYLACDRPSQIRRAFARRFGEEHRDALAERLAVHDGYLPVMLDQHPDLLHRLVEAVGADVVVIDSLKDVATELEKGPNAILINQALQRVCQAQAEVIVLHHQRKAQGDNKRPKAIDDLYGNTLIPSGAGSVLLVWGAPGDLAVELHHLKKPADEVGPLKLLHDHETGTTRIDDAAQVDLLVLARRATGGLTVAAAATALYGTAATGKVTQAVRNDREKARYQLEKAVDRGVLRRVEGVSAALATYVPVDAPTVLHVDLGGSVSDPL